MTFISYAQNYEDVMLWRALKHVQSGFYIDVGAWSPDIDSVTRVFYENNWSGINIEPNPEFHSLYQSRRPRDINLRVALGDKEGTLLINFMSNPGLSTAVEKFAEQHKSAGWISNKQEVQLTTLANICSENISIDRQIHFLKVDVEGFEEAVLRGNDWTQYRPWVVVIEATLPMSNVESYAPWEPILLTANYQFVYADGLNRFYVANEHAELREVFKYPPNVFDGFLLVTQQEAEAKAQQAEAKAQQAEAKAQQAEAKAQQADAKAQQAESIAQHYAATLSALYTSKSWRLTAPLRWFVGQARRLQDDGVKSRLRVLIKKTVRYLIILIKANPKLYKVIKVVDAKLGIGDFVLTRAGFGVGMKPTVSEKSLIVKMRRVTADEAENINLLMSEGVKRLLIIRGDINSHAGYAKACSLYKKMLRSRYDFVAGVDLHPHPRTNVNGWDELQISEDQLHIICSLGKWSIDVITISSPDDFIKYEGAKNIGLFFWETDRIGRQNWIKAINQLDELWLPTQFMHDALHKERVNIVMKIVAVPLDEKIVEERRQHITQPKTIWRMGKRGQEPILVSYDSIPKDKFKLLTINTLIGRKGYPILFSEISRLKNPDSVALIVKASSVDVRHDENYIIEEIRKYIDLMDLKVDVYVLHRTLKESEMVAVENDCNAFVTCSYGEGFGLGVFQMYYSGKPVICAKHTAFMEYLPQDYQYFMDCEIQNVSLVDPVNVYPISAKWGVPKEGELLRVLNKILGNK